MTTRKSCEAKAVTFDRNDHDQGKDRERKLNDNLIREIGLSWIRVTRTKDIHVGIAPTKIRNVQAACKSRCSALFVQRFLVFS